MLFWSAQLACLVIKANLKPGWCFRLLFSSQLLLLFLVSFMRGPLRGLLRNSWAEFENPFLLLPPLQNPPATLLLGRRGCVLPPYCTVVNNDWALPTPSAGAERKYYCVPQIPTLLGSLRFWQLSKCFVSFRKFGSMILFYVFLL